MLDAGVWLSGTLQSVCLAVSKVTVIVLMTRLLKMQSVSCSSAAHPAMAVSNCFKPGCLCSVHVACLGLLRPCSPSSWPDLLQLAFTCVVHTCVYIHTRLGAAWCIRCTRYTWVISAVCLITVAACLQSLAQAWPPRGIGGLVGSLSRFVTMQPHTRVPCNNHQLGMNFRT